MQPISCHTRVLTRVTTKIEEHACSLHTSVNLDMNCTVHSYISSASEADLFLLSPLFGAGLAKYKENKTDNDNNFNN